MVAAAVLIAYALQITVYLPFLRREFSISVGDIIDKVWPIVPALGAGWIVASGLPGSFGASFFSLAIRGLLTAAVVALIHGLFSRFRCFVEVVGMISQNFPREAGAP
jgi:hypothetical protein